jgi:CRP-like cAMP-binding protein
MADQNAKGGIRERITAQTEDAFGKLAQDLLENPLINSAIARAFDARERAAQAQEVAMGALNLPSASDVERLTRRLRSVSQRLEGIEDVLDRLERRLGALTADEGAADRLTGLEEQLSQLTRLIGDLGESLPGRSAPVPTAQERLAVEAPAEPSTPAAGARTRATTAKPKRAPSARG